MGYLFDNLPKSKEQIVECPKLYKYIMRVARRKPPIIALATNDNDIKVSMIVKNTVPDVEEWQYVNQTERFYHFRFHIPYQRQQAVEALRLARYYVETEDEP